MHLSKDMFTLEVTIVASGDDKNIARMRGVSTLQIRYLRSTVDMRNPLTAYAIALTSRSGHRNNNVRVSRHVTAVLM